MDEANVLIILNYVFIIFSYIEAFLRILATPISRKRSCMRGEYYFHLKLCAYVHIFIHRGIPAHIGDPNQPQKLVDKANEIYLELDDHGAVAATLQAGAEIAFRSGRIYYYVCV